MSDLRELGMRREPSRAEVVGRAKDDGDFDALRRAIIRKVKDNVSSHHTPPTFPLVCRRICCKGSL